MNVKVVEKVRGRRQAIKRCPGVRKLKAMKLSEKNVVRMVIRRKFMPFLRGDVLKDGIILTNDLLNLNGGHCELCKLYMPAKLCWTYTIEEVCKKCPIWIKSGKSCSGESVNTPYDKLANFIDDNYWNPDFSDYDKLLEKVADVVAWIQEMFNLPRAVYKNGIYIGQAKVVKLIRRNK